MSHLPVVQGQYADELLIVDTETGEQLVPVDATNEQIARWRRAVLDAEGLIRAAKKIVDAVVLARMDSEASWTIHAGGMTLTAPSPAPSIEYEDPEAMRKELLALPRLAQHAVERAVKMEVSYKPQAGGIKKLRMLKRADVDAVLDKHATSVDKDRRVSVKAAA